MPKFIRNEINHGYVNFIKTLTAPRDIKKRKLVIRVLRGVIIYSIKSFFILILILYGLVITLLLRIRLSFEVRSRPSELHLEAIKNITKFISQYPMHLYPIVAKSLELSFIADNIKKVTNQIKDRTIEFAVGDGTLSGKIFSNGEKIICFDLNPYSLMHTKNYEHISKWIVADCMDPPVAPRGASLIVCNNLLHHITDKEHALNNWAQIAPCALFNENTNYWASSWYKPFILRLFGLNDKAKSAAYHIEKHSLQSLWRKEQLMSSVEKYYDIIEEKSFFNEKVFFLSSVCSALLFCYGPPTPKLQKKIMNGLLWSITRAVTYHMAKALIEYDAILPRDKDSFIFWLVKSKLIDKDNSSSRVSLVCPDCRELLQGNLCNICKRTFEEKDGMFFLLPKDLTEEAQYSPFNANVLDKEHL